MRVQGLILLSAIVVGCGGGGGSGGTPTGPNPPGSGNPTTAAVGMRTEYDQIYAEERSYFQPNAVSVSRNGTVTWTNTTGIDHNVTFTAAAGVPANVPNHSSGSNSRTFATAGTFNYSCTNHVGMVGSVTVQ